MRIAHAALAASAFLVFFPIGGVIIRIWDPRVERYSYIVWIHAVLQGVGYVLFTAAAGMGIYMAKHLHAVSGDFAADWALGLHIQELTNILQLGQYHPIIGLSVFILMALQPLTELLNHYLFERYPRVRYVGYVHVWLGRLLLTLGIINGGLGFHFADSIPGPQWPRWPKIAYGAIATMTWIIYVAIIIVWTKFNDTEAVDEVGDEEAVPRATTAEVNAASSSDPNTTADVDETQDILGPTKDTEQEARSKAL
jgi:hypothetical protein